MYNMFAITEIVQPHSPHLRPEDGSLEGPALGPWLRDADGPPRPRRPWKEVRYECHVTRWLDLPGWSALELERED